MSQPRGPGRPYDRPHGIPAANHGGTGSVRRARERMEANTREYTSEPLRGTTQVAQLQQNSNFQPSSRAQEPISRVPPSHIPRVANRSRPNPSVTRAIVSKSTPIPNPSWPLPEDSAARNRNNSPDRSAAPSKPPQRPPRPDYIPEMLLQQSNQPSPSFQNYEQQQSPPPRQQPYNNQRPYWQDDYSLTLNQDKRPANWASNSGSRPSTSSSFASIPDFPVPVPALPFHSPPQQMPRRMPANLGPPPSSRKGASSYYSQSSFVSPIPEDPEPRGTSYASSHVMPTSWGDGPPEYYMGGGPGDEDDDDRFEGDDGRFSRGDHDEDSNLVRQASLGKRHKPALTMIKSDEGIQGHGLNAANVPRSKGTVPESSGAGRDIMAGATVGAFAAGLSSPNPSVDMMSSTDSFSGGTVLLDASSSNVSSDRTGTGISNVSGNSNPKEQPSPALDPRVREIMGGLQRGGALQQGIPEPVTSPLAGASTRRPPPLNIDAVKKAEARGSLTSLPDLIRRATRVASNLDKGRTASRLGMLDAFGPPRSPHPHNRSPLSRQGSLSDMLGSFPPPGVGTPTTDRPQSRWPSPFASSSAPMNRGTSVDAPPTYSSEKPKARRRCCGLPVWGFVLLLLILLLLAAAAVVIPIVLIVIPRSDNSNNNPTEQTSVAGCQSALSCSNGGNSVLFGKNCGCICANGFTGSTCINPPTSDCSTTDFPADMLRKVTLGTNVSSVISTSQSTFGIPLNATIILSSFAASNLSCTSENNIVTFNLPNSNSQSNSRRSFHAENIDALRPFILMLSSPHKVRPRSPEISPQVTPPAEVINDAPPSAAVVTSNGIIIAASATAGGDSPSPTIAKGTGTVVTTSTAATATASAGGSSNAPSSKDIEFSKAAILKVLEANGVPAAQQAQMQLQTMFLGGTFRGGKVDAGNGITFDFSSDAVMLGNGMTVGGKSA